MMPILVDRRQRPGADDLVSAQMKMYERLVVDLGQPGWSFDLVLIEDEAMTNLNSQFRSRDVVTDVLSFSYLMEEGPGTCDLSRGSLGAGADLWLDDLAVPGGREDPVQVGEVVLAPGFITTRCQSESWSLQDEFPMLVVHGALHLLGWDHLLSDEAAAMRNLEAKLLAECGLSHPLRIQEGT